MAIETEMSLNADGNTAVTACLRQQLADCSMLVMLLREMNGLQELTDGLTALTAWVMWQTEGDGELQRWCLTEETRRGMMALCREDIYKPEHITGI